VAGVGDGSGGRVTHAEAVSAAPSVLRPLGSDIDRSTALTLCCAAAEASEAPVVAAVGVPTFPMDEGGSGMGGKGEGEVGGGGYHCGGGNPSGGADRRVAVHAAARSPWTRGGGARTTRGFYAVGNTPPPFVLPGVGLDEPAASVLLLGSGDLRTPLYSVY